MRWLQKGNNKMYLFLIPMVIIVSYFVFMMIYNHFFFKLVPQTNGSHLILSTNHSDTYCEIDSDLFTANFSMKTFCNWKICSLPLLYPFNNITFKRKGKVVETIPKKWNKDTPIKCSGNSPDNRICTFRDITYNGEKFVINSPYRLHFKEDILNLGSYDVRFDRTENTHFSNFSSSYYISSRYIPEHSYLMTVSKKEHMVWHQYFDFLLPAYLTMDIDNEFDRNSRILIPPYVKQYTPLIQALSKHNVTYLKPQMSFKSLTLGMFKNTVKEFVGPFPKLSFPPKSALKLRKLVLKYFNIKPKSNEECSVILISRKGQSRTFKDEGEVFNTVKKAIPKCKVSLLHFEDMEIKEQVREVANSQALIGIYGSGLSNLLWLPPKAKLINILPYHLKCWDWMSKGAITNDIEYYTYITSPNETIPPDTEEYKECMKLDDPCMDIKCEKPLISENFNLNLANLETFLKQIFG